jgi:hypothetical protein
MVKKCARYEHATSYWIFPPKFSMTQYSMYMCNILWRSYLGRFSPHFSYFPWFNSTTIFLDFDGIQELTELAICEIRASQLEASSDGRANLSSAERRISARKKYIFLAQVPRPHRFESRQCVRLLGLCAFQCCYLLTSADGIRSHDP